jgi:hypothetical protein
VNNQRVQHCCQTPAPAQGGLSVVALCSRVNNERRSQPKTSVCNFSQKLKTLVSILQNKKQNKKPSSTAARPAMDGK